MLGPSELTDTLYYDTAVFSTTLLRRLVEDVGVDHVLLGTDHPFELGDRTPLQTVLALGLDTTGSLVVSQVVLSFGIPFALTPLVLLTRRRDVMGKFVNSRLTTALASVVVAMIVALNVYLLYVTFFG